jgi:hypothetical protein
MLSRRLTLQGEERSSAMNKKGANNRVLAPVKTVDAQ